MDGGEIWKRVGFVFIKSTPQKTYILWSYRFIANRMLQLKKPTTADPYFVQMSLSSDQWSPSQGLRLPKHIFRVSSPPQPGIFVSWVCCIRSNWQHFVYQCAIFLIIKHEQRQIHSSEIKEKPLQFQNFIFGSSVFMIFWHSNTNSIEYTLPL